MIKTLRETIGSDKLITLTDYEDPTAYFWDTEAMGGIAVGEYLDYAWSGYNSEEEQVQIVDPWHQGANMFHSMSENLLRGLMRQNTAVLIFRGIRHLGPERYDTYL